MEVDQGEKYIPHDLFHRYCEKCNKKFRTNMLRHFYCHSCEPLLILTCHELNSFALKPILTQFIVNDLCGMRLVIQPNSEFDFTTDPSLFDDTTFNFIRVAPGNYSAGVCETCGQYKDFLIGIECSSCYDEH